MENTDIKPILVEACRKKLTESTNNLSAAMDDLQQQSNDYGAPKDRYDSFRTQLLRKRDMLAQQLQKELNELKVLDKIDSRKTVGTVQFGAIVFTEEQNYFVAAGLGRIEAEGVIYFAISAQVPVYQALAGKKKGDSIEFRGRKISIMEIV
jgi:transcription elongation GreA/GreB family factor